MSTITIDRKFRNFIRFHTHVTYPETSERRQQINTLEVIKKLDAIGMSHIDMPMIWDGVHLVDEGKVAGRNEIERRVRFTYKMRMWKLTQFVDEIFHFADRDIPTYLDLATCLREVEFDLIKGRTDIDRAIANIAVIATTKRSLAVGIPPEVITYQINWALREVAHLDVDEIELLECLPDEDSLKPSDKVDFDQMAQDRGISGIRLADNIDTRGRIASLFSDCFGGKKKKEGQKEMQPLSIRRLDVASRFLAEPSLEALLRISRIANEYVAFQPRFEKKMVAAPDGDQTRMRMMASYSELPRLAPAAWALKVASPKYFRYRLATKSFMVREKIKRSDKKQFFYAMLDRSKSMQQGERIYKLLAILMNRLRAVGRREAILGYSFFDSVVHDEIMVNDVNDVKEEIRKLHHEFFVGDDTDINLALREGIQRIRRVVGEIEADRPELIIVTDGDHGINVKVEELKGIILHVFVVEQQNEDLMELARKTGGVALEQL
ncbi:MAG: vWA domain-containing protein [Pirellulaceae bacterium]